MKLLFDPRFFNILLLVLFALAAIRWGFAKNWAQATYFGGAFVLNYAVTFMEMK